MSKISEYLDKEYTDRSSFPNPFKHNPCVFIEFGTWGDIGIDGDLMLGELEEIVVWLKKRKENA